MKKLICALTLTVMLCGCGSTDVNSPDNSDSTQETTEVEYIDEYETMTTYTSLEEFKGSSFYKGLKEQGINTYTLDYDQERYTLSRIDADASFYEYNLYDNTEQRGVNYTICYSPGTTSFGTLWSTFYNEKNIRTTAENNGEVYEVCLNAIPYVDYEDYGLIYLPFEGYRVSIYADGQTSADEILAYFNEFTLVPDEEE